MLYAIARHSTKVDARRFLRMYEAMNAPIERAKPQERALFSSETIENVFVCRERAFDYSVLRDTLLAQIADLPVTFVLETQVTSVARAPGGGLEATLSDGLRIGATEIFNVTYSGLNTLADGADFGRLPLKHELVEIALVAPPPALANLGITVMDGPFFSCMPFPSAGLHSLTHVRYTPHFSWTDAQSGTSADTVAAAPATRNPLAPHGL